MGKKTAFAKAMAKSDKAQAKATAKSDKSRAEAEAKAYAGSDNGVEAKAEASATGAKAGKTTGKSTVSFKVDGEEVSVETDGDGNITMGNVTIGGKKK